MSRSSLRLWSTLAILGLTLTACSTSESSSQIRTRNSALIESCVTARPSLTEPIISVTIADNGCADGIVRIDEAQHGSPAPTYTNNPVSDKRHAEMNIFTLYHRDRDYRLDFEARQGDTPIEHTQVTGNGNDPSSVRLTTATITEVDSSGICLQPIRPRAASMGALMQGCGDSDYFLTTLKRSIYEYIKYTQAVTYTGQFTRIEPANHYFSIIAMRDGFPHAKMTAVWTNDDTVEYRFFKYSRPTSVTPFTVQQASVTDEEPVLAPTSTTEASSTTVTPTTMAITTTTPIPASTSAPSSSSTSSSSTSSSSTSSTSTSTSTTSSTTTTVAPVLATSTRSVKDACEKLEGVGVYPGLENWTSSTLWEITVSNDCMRQTPTEGSVHSMAFIAAAKNKATGERIALTVSGDRYKNVAINGRLYAGDWTIEIRQFAFHLPSFGQAQRFNTQAIINVSISQDLDDDWNLCDSKDVAWNGSELVLECDYSKASLGLQRNGSTLNVDHTKLSSSGTPTPITVDPGWQWGYVNFEIDGFKGVVNVLLCSSQCGTLPSSLDFNTSFDGPVLTVDPRLDDCTPSGRSAWFHQLRKVNENLIVYNGPDRNHLAEAYFDPREGYRFDLRSGTDHIMFLEALSSSPTCRLQAEVGLARWSIIAIVNTTAPGTPDTTVDTTIRKTPVVPESSDQPSPAQVTTLEFSRVDTIGTPIVVEAQQTSIVVSPMDIPEFVASSESGVTEVSIQDASGQWTPVALAAPTVVPLAEKADEVKVKFTFSDGTEAVVTKPVISPADIATDSGESSSSNVWLFIVLGLFVLAVLAGILALRSRNV